MALYQQTKNFRKDKCKFYKEVKRLKDDIVSTEIETINLKVEKFQIEFSKIIGLNLT